MHALMVWKAKLAGKRIAGFVKAEPVFSVALIAALLSMIAVPPNPAYAGYIKWRTLGLLVMFMLCVAGLEKAGVLLRVARLLLDNALHARRGGTKMLVGALVLLPYLGAIFITNDVALLTFVPFACMVLMAQKRSDLIPLVLALQTIAANAGSYLTPFGNPHNLYSYMLFDVDFSSFVAAQAPFTVLLGAFLATCILLFVHDAPCKRKEKEEGKKEEPLKSGAAAVTEDDMNVSKADAVLFAVLFVLSVLSVLRVIPVRYALFLIAAVVFVRDRALFCKVDWLLLATFVCFFVFSSNLAAIPAISTVLTEAMGEHPFWITMGASQIISNVPACTLLAPFTTDWRALAIGANLGGLGSPIGSMASLITLGFYRRTCKGGMRRFMKVFVALNVAALVVCCALWVVLGVVA